MVPQKARIRSFLENFGFSSACWYPQEISSALLRRGRESPNHLKHEQSTTANGITQLTSTSPTQSCRELLHGYLSLRRPRRIRESSPDEQLVLDGLPLRRKGRSLGLNAKHALQRVRVKVFRGPAAGADVWEETEGAYTLENVRDGEDVVGDDRWW